MEKYCNCQLINGKPFYGNRHRETCPMASKETTKGKEKDKKPVKK